ncbi:MAG: hypothetical protein Fur0042_23000 [Cyanophyceae cyanobacterium]
MTSKRKNFSGFTLAEAYQYLNLSELKPWELGNATQAPSDFFRERLRRLQAHFDLRYCEKSKELLIDAFCEEAIADLDRLKIWKGVKLETEQVTGNVDYLITERRDYVAAPFLCIVEAKKDDFEQGLAQCLVEMKACQTLNRDRAIVVFGIVTNGDGWRFYRLDSSGQGYETGLYSNRNVDELLGALHTLFSQCSQHLAEKI